jgi:hypothetical protein
MSKKPIVVERRHGRADRGRGVTYQLELVLCGKPRCRKRHGPYWYAYWSRGNRTRKRYVGKQWRELNDVEREGPAKKPVLGNAPARDRALPKTGFRRGPRRSPER